MNDGWCVVFRASCYNCFGMRIHVEHSITGVRPLPSVDANACQEISQNILKILLPSTPNPHHRVLSFPLSLSIPVWRARWLNPTDVKMRLLFFATAVVSVAFVVAVWLFVLCMLLFICVWRSFLLFAHNIKYDVSRWLKDVAVSASVILCWCSPLWIC